MTDVPLADEVLAVEVDVGSVPVGHSALVYTVKDLCQGDVSTNWPP